jgi:ParB/RepB/Spo0J family partition protein
MEKLELLPPGNTTKYKAHALAETVPGEMGKDEFAALCASIKANGQQNPIIIYEDQILDGRHRERACQQLKVKPIYAKFTGTKEEAIALVLIWNLDRRQLTSIQRGVVAARMHLKNGTTQREAGLRAGVSPTTVNMLVKLLNSKNTPLIRRAEMGDISREEIEDSLAPPPPAAPLKAATPAPADKPSDAPSVPAVGTKPQHPERRPTGTDAGTMATLFRGMSKEDRISFVELTWHILRPSIFLAGKCDSVGMLLGADAAPPEATDEEEPEPAKPLKGKGVRTPIVH